MEQRDVLMVEIQQRQAPRKVGLDGRMIEGMQLGKHRNQPAQGSESDGMLERRVVFASFVLRQPPKIDRRDQIDEWNLDSSAKLPKKLLLHRRKWDSPHRHALTHGIFALFAHRLARTSVPRIRVRKLLAGATA